MLARYARDISPLILAIMLLAPTSALALPPGITLPPGVPDVFGDDCTVVITITNDDANCAREIQGLVCKGIQDGELFARELAAFLYVRAERLSSNGTCQVSEAISQATAGTNACASHRTIDPSTESRLKCRGMSTAGAGANGGVPFNLCGDGSAGAMYENEITLPDPNSAEVCVSLSAGVTITNSPIGTIQEAWSFFDPYPYVVANGAGAVSDSGFEQQQTGGAWIPVSRDALPDCRDGFDNDGDGNVDHPADPDCNGPSDTTETSEPVPTLSPWALGILAALAIATGSWTLIRRVRMA